MKELAGLRWKPLWTTHIGCMAACARHLGIDADETALFAGTGHAFIVNIHETLCPSGPTAWRTDMLFELAGNLGLDLERLAACAGEGCSAGIRELAGEFVREALDGGRPCYGWELDLPEYYVIYGYDASGIWISGPRCIEGRGPVPWEDLTHPGTGWIELYRARPCPAASLRKTLREAFIAALAHAGNTEGWIMESYRSGPAAFHAWAETLAGGREVSSWAVAYNAEVVCECRSHAFLFLEAALPGLGSPELAGWLREMASLYRDIERNLSVVRGEYPFLGPGIDPEVSPEGRGRAVLALRAAAAGEQRILELMEKAIPRF